MERINATVEDDVTYQRIKLLPKRSHHYSVHRRLSWQCQKDVEQFERDAKMATFEVTRGQTAIRDRLNQLNKTKRELVSKHVPEMHAGHVSFRRRSCPILNSCELKMAVDNSDVNEDDDDVNHARPVLHRSETVDGAGHGRDLLLAIRRFTSPSIKPFTRKDVTFNPDLRNEDIPET